MTFREWINQKGPHNLHVVLGHREGTIRMWATRNHVPYKVWPEVMEKMPEIGLKDLTDMRTASASVPE